MLLTFDDGYTKQLTYDLDQELSEMGIHDDSTLIQIKS